jgi:hypothetical protein
LELVPEDAAYLPALPEHDIAARHATDTAGTTPSTLVQQMMDLQSQLHATQSQLHAMKSQLDQQGQWMQQWMQQQGAPHPVHVAITQASAPGSASASGPASSPGPAFALSPANPGSMIDTKSPTMGGNISASEQTYALNTSRHQALVALLHLGVDTARGSGMNPMLDFYFPEGAAPTRANLRVALSRSMVSIMHWLDPYYLHKVPTSQHVRWKGLSSYWFPIVEHTSTDQRRISCRSPMIPFGSNTPGITTFMASDVIVAMQEEYQKHERGDCLLTRNILFPDRPDYDPFQLQSQLSADGTLEITKNPVNKTRTYEVLKRMRAFVAPTAEGVQESFVRLLGSKHSLQAPWQQRHFWNLPDSKEFLQDEAFQMGVVWVNEVVYGRTVTLTPEHPQHVGHNWQVLPDQPVVTREDQLQRMWGSVPPSLHETRSPSHPTRPRKRRRASATVAASPSASSPSLPESESKELDLYQLMEAALGHAGSVEWDPVLDHKLDQVHDQAPDQALGQTFEHGIDLDHTILGSKRPRNPEPPMPPPLPPTSGKAVNQAKSPPPPQLMASSDLVGYPVNKKLYRVPLPTL